ncbi:nucleoporin Nup120/160-domain-containing protein [Terfezia claveryi]|nr:nucleoporin Nup120/160-domain-containing protein [Terfezia claveryi]
MAERACVLFKETRISTDAATASSTAPNVVNVRLPSHRASATQAPRRRSIHIRSASPSSQSGSTTEKQRDIEAIFASNSLARAASVYFRRYGTSPRNILYRVVEEWEVLSIQAVDMMKGPEEATIGVDVTTPVLRFHFPDKIRENCVAFADVPNKDEVTVYVMTVVNIIYTLTLKGEILRGGGGIVAAAKAGRGGGIGLGNLKEPEFCRTFYPSAFSLSSPHFLVAVDHERILVSLQDGNLLKLERGLEDDPDVTEAVYYEKKFSDTGVLSIFRNKLPWVTSGTSRYKDTHVSHSTVISIEFFTPKGGRESEEGTAIVGYSAPERSHTLLFTVSINHTLKVWSYERQQLLHVSDLMNQPPNDSNIKTLIHPAPAQLLSVIRTTLSCNHLFYLVTYSPVSTGSFKFWIGHGDVEGRFSHLEDMYKENIFDAMPPTASSIWIISDFRVTPVSKSKPGVQNMWILWKSNTSFKIQNLQFHIQTIPEAWNHWATSTTDSIHSFTGKVPSTPIFGDVTERWMEWIFYPERFPESVIEASLAIYEQHFSRALNIRTSRTMSLKARVGRIVASAVELQKTKDGNVNLEKFKHEVGLQWDRFVRLCVELDRQRGEALSLVYDPVMGYIWAVNADGLTALRECTETEMIVHNLAAPKELYKVMTDSTTSTLGANMNPAVLSQAILLIRAAADLVGSIQTDDMEQCIIALQEETLEDPMASVNDRMWNLLERCITGKVPRHVLEKIDNTFMVLERPENTIQAILSSIFCPTKETGSSRLTEFGARVLVKGAQEVININYTILFNLTLLVTIATFPPDSQNKIMINGEELFSQLITYLKEYEILKWMARKLTSMPEHPTPEDALTATLSGLQVSDSPDSKPIAKTGSVLQLVLPDDLSLTRDSLSSTIRNFLASLNLRHEWGVLDVASTLIGANPTALATKFQKFLPNTPWGCYLKGRIDVKNGDHAKAVVLFKRAAGGLGFSLDKYPDNAVRDVIGDGEVHSFGSGLPQYYMHIARLFEECEGWGHVADFCRAALNTLRKEVRK